MRLKARAFIPSVDGQVLARRSLETTPNGGKCKKTKLITKRELMKFKSAIFLGTIISSILLLSCKKNNKEIHDNTCTPTIIKRDSGDNSPLRITVKVTGKKPKAIDGTLNKYPFRITLQNQTDSVFGFWLLSCSYYDYFEWNTKGIGIYSEGCDSNFPMLIELTPGKDYNIGGEFVVYESETIKRQKNLRLGLHVIGKEYNLNRWQTLQGVEIKDTLIWCKEPIKYDW